MFGVQSLQWSYKANVALPEFPLDQSDKCLTLTEKVHYHALLFTRNQSKSSIGAEEDVENIVQQLQRTSFMYQEHGAAQEPLCMATSPKHPTAAWLMADATVLVHCMLVSPRFA